jgi:hypothetical protein
MDTDFEYYPLSEGNIWTCRTWQGGSKEGSPVTWRVKHAEKTPEGVVYQVWPTPVQEDD